GEHEATIIQSWTRGANLRRWLTRIDCPPFIREFARIFEFSLGTNLGQKLTPETGILRSAEHAHFTYAGTSYSRTSTHPGNAIIKYCISTSNEPLVGSIQKITVGLDTVSFTVERQDLLPRGKNDPFAPFPHIPATTYSSKLSGITDEIHPSAILGHCARFDFSDERAVFLFLSRE
ncbi:hypothetical protein C8F01DRAFT_970743, partial [Mycena amicta]